MKIIPKIIFLQEEQCDCSYLVEDLCGNVRLCVEEVEDIAGVLDSVFGRLLWGSEAIVTGSVEILKAAGVVLQLVTLSWHDSLLFGHAAKERQRSDVSVKPVEQPGFLHY